MGAYELDNKVVWTGNLDTNWYNTSNWSTESLPNSDANIIIDEGPNFPVINYGIVECNGMILMKGTSIKIKGSARLRIIGMN